MEEAREAKADLLDRLYDFLYFEADEHAANIANTAEIISEIMDPNFPMLQGCGSLAQRQALALATLALTGSTTLSLEEISRLSGVSLDLLEGACLVIRPGLAAQAAPKQKKAARSKKKKK